MSRYRQVAGDVRKANIPAGEGIAYLKRYAGINRRAAMVYFLTVEQTAIGHEYYVVRSGHVHRCHGQISGDFIVRYVPAGEQVACSRWISRSGCASAAIYGFCFKRRAIPVNKNYCVCYNSPVRYD